MKNIKLSKLFLLVLAVSAVAFGGQLQFKIVSPEVVGLSPERVEHIHQTFQELVDEGKIAGVSVLISRDGKIAFWDTLGFMDIETKKPVSKDTIFRIASMAKAVTSVCVLKLYEQGHFLLDDPVSKYIPEFKQMKVTVAAGAENQDGTKEVPAKRDITIRDLLRHTSGILYGGKSYREAGFNKWDKPLGDFVKKLAQLPLACEPGTKFNYSYSIDVLGYLVEIISGQPLDEYMKQQVFEPLGMVDTDFYVPEEKLARLPNHYRYKDGSLILDEPSKTSPFLKKPIALSGGGGWSTGYGGLVTTMQDWLRFLEMLRNYGRLEDTRILNRKTVELMTADHLKDISGAFEPGTGHGLGIGVVTDAAKHGQLASAGTIYWAGAPYNTYYFVDYKEQMCGILFMQNGPFGHLDLMRRFLVLAHQAIDK